MEEEEYEEMMRERADWYRHDSVLFEIVKDCSHREAAFLPMLNEQAHAAPVRLIKAFKVAYLRSNMQAFGFLEKPYNLYRSVATYRNIPTASYAPAIRKQAQDWFNQHYEGDTYEVPLDFDAHETPYAKAYNDVKKTLRLLRDYHVPHTLKFSGSGFHLNIPLPLLFKEAVIAAKKYTDKLRALLNLGSLDMGVADARRIWKAAYSYDVLTGRIALPLSPEEFKNFSVEDTTPKNIIPKVYKRGIPIHNKEGTPQHTLRMLRDLEVI